MAALERLTKVSMNEDLDPYLALKILRETKDIAQAVPKDKVDQYANLQVFNIVMHNGRLGGGLSVQPVPQLVEEVSDVFELGSARPSPLMLAATNINLDVISRDNEEVGRPPADRPLDRSAAHDDIFNGLNGALGIAP